MDTSDINLICGEYPVNFQKEKIEGNDYIFQVDPNFTPINLYNFWGNSATVNSFSECLHYVEGGFKPSITTIFDIGIIFLTVLIGSFALYKFITLGFYSKLISTFKIKILNLKKYNFSKQKNYIIFPFFLIKIYFLFDYIRTKSVRIPNFIDEYISLTANVNFFKNLDFNAGEFLGGSYGVALTSGPISAIGSVIGWNLTSKLAIARISNFFWIYILQIIFIIILKKVYQKDVSFLIYINGLIFILIPWWQGSLYSLGEIPSLIVFVNAIFLFPKLRYASIILFSLSIVYGKILNLVPFAGFYLIHMINEKKLQNIYKDIGVFFLPLTSWLLLAHFNYEKGNLNQYLQDQFYFIINHQSSGTSIDNGSFIFNFTNAINASEFSSWNNFDKIRLIIIPILFCVILNKNKEKIDSFFGKVSIPLIFSISFSYLWFWILNDTKWMRHTQHFSVLLLIAIIYFINYKLIEERLDLILIIMLFAIFINNNKSLGMFLVIISTIIIYKTQTNIKHDLIKFLIVVIILIDISIPYFQKNTFGNLNNIIDSCKKELISVECLEDYENQ